MTRRQFLKRSFFVASSAVAGVCAYTWRWEPHWVEFTQVRLPIANLAAELIGARVVQLTDLHIGPRVSDSFLIETFAEVHGLGADFVVYTGDFTSYEGDIYSRAEKVFPHLSKGKRGTYGILGNHDYGINWNHPEVAARLAAIAKNAGVTILRNEVAEKNGLQFVGLDDLWAEHFRPERALPEIDGKRAAIVLSHNPDTVDLPVWGDYKGWILAGHTHGGQCKPPFLPPPVLPVRNRRYTAGEFQLAGNRRLYISRGLGHTMPIRFNVRPEVTLFELSDPLA